MRVSHQCLKVFHHHQSFVLTLVRKINFYQPTSTSLHTYKLDRKHLDVHILISTSLTLVRLRMEEKNEIIGNILEGMDHLSKTRASTTRASKLAVDTGLTLENEAKKDRNGPHKSSKKVHKKVIIGSTNESDNNRAIVNDNANELATIKTAINELAATVAGLAQRVSNNTQQANCSHNPADEDGEEGEDESIIEPPPKRAREDASETPKPNESGSGLMDKFAKEFKVSEKCGPAVNEKLAEVVTNILANGIDSDTVTEKSKAYKRPHNVAMPDITRVEP